MKLKQQLISELERISGLEDRPSKVAGGSAIFYKEKEIAHFHGPNEIDLRLTKKVIKERGLTHPLDSDFHPKRARSSDWIELRFTRASHIGEIVELFKLATKQY